MVANREVGPGFLYLVHPYAGPSASKVDPNDLLRNFFADLAGCVSLPRSLPVSFTGFPVGRLNMNRESSIGWTGQSGKGLEPFSSVLRGMNCW